MKLSAHMPPPPPLPQRQIDALVRLRDDLLHETLGEYTQFRQRQSHEGDYVCRTPLRSAWSSSVPAVDASPEAADAVDANSMVSGVDRARWKLLKQQHQLAVFKERSGIRSENKLVKLRVPGAVDVYDILETKSSVSRLLMVGTVRGQLDDAMYGGFVRNDHDFRVRSAYAKDDLADVKFLHELEAPTLQDPFRFCGVAWVAHGSVPIPFVKQRDTVLLLSSGLVDTANGERIGFVIMHSVRLPELKNLENLPLVRAYGSVCILKRQSDDNRVEQFSTGFFAPMGELSERACLQSIVRSMLSSGMTTETAYSKKLYWMMQCSNDRQRQQRSQSRHDHEDDGECAGGCPRKRFFNGLRSRRGSCMICRRSVCSTCRVSRAIAIGVASTEQAQQKELDFCLFCVDHAKRLSATAVASRELLGRRHTNKPAKLAADQLLLVVERDLLSSFGSSGLTDTS